MSTKVTLREKKIKRGMLSLYLDFYPPIVNPETGKPTRREFLKIHVYEKPKTDYEKDHNKLKRIEANEIWNERSKSILNKQYDFLVKEKKDVDFVDFFESIIKTKTGSNKNGWKTVLIYLKQFTGGKLPIENLNKKKCNEFKEFLLTAKRQRGYYQNKQISKGSARTYFNLFKAALKQAYKKELLGKDLSTSIEAIKTTEVKREYLTLKELETLAKTPCRYPFIRNAALFAALTGLRISDIEKLTWEEVRSDGDLHTLVFRQKKTKNIETLPISEEAFSLLGERGNPTEQVFKGLKYSNYFNLHLKQWILEAGITKDITFHCFRHTYATLQLSLGTDVYTVSKLLGHRDIKTTEIYLNIIDKNKREAANRIKLNL